MTKKILIGIGVLILVIAAIAGISRQTQKAAVSPADIEKDFAAENEALSQDINDVEELSQDANLDDLEGALNEAAEEKPASEISGTKKVELASIENMESELTVELNGLSTDLNDLGGFEGDTSFGSLETELSGM